MILGLDIGYRYTNITDGKDTITFPSMIAQTRSTQIERLPGQAMPDIVFYAGVDYLIGEAAQNHGKFGRATLNRFRTGSDEYKLLFLYALAKLTGFKNKYNLQIVTGLPHSDYGDRGKVVKTMSGTHKLKINGQSLTYKVSETVVIPQPLGTLTAEIYRANGKGLITINPDLKNRPCVIIDIGGLTIGFMRYAGAYSFDKSTSIEVGVAAYGIQQLQDDIYRQYKAKISFEAAEEALMTNSCLISGKPIDVSRLVNPILQEITQQAISTARQLWDDTASDEYMFLTGGGATLVANRFIQQFGRSTIRKVRNPHLANVKGFYLFGLGMKQGGRW